MNAVVRDKADLEARNYVRKADPAKHNYWHDWSCAEMNRKRLATGDNFYLILHGSSANETDFFVIP